jgi:hypothetical protein
MHHSHISCTAGSPCRTFGIANLTSNGEILSEVGRDDPLIPLLLGINFRK